MTTYDDYRGADCSLYRIPPIQLDEVKEMISRAFLEAWKNGSSVEGVVEKVLTDDKVTGKLQSQIRRNLHFQRNTGMAGLDGEAQKRFDEYAKNKQAQLDNTHLEWGVKAEQTQQEIEEARKACEEESQSYTMAQKNLEVLRAQIRERLKAVGGIGVLESVARISGELVQGEGAVPPVIAQTSDLTKLVDGALKSERYDPLSDERKKAEAAGIKLAPVLGEYKEGRVRGFFKKTRSVIHSILFYEIPLPWKKKK